MPRKKTLRRAHPSGMPPKRIPGASPSPKTLSFSDLEIPVERLLTAAEEVTHGRRVKVYLRRLARLLPRHPLGYRRFLDRMEEVLAGGGLPFSWLSMRESVRKDVEGAREALERASKLARRSPAKAPGALEEGARLLLTYPLDAETLLIWTRDVLTRPGEPGHLMQAPHYVRLDAIVRRLLEAIEKARDRLVLPNLRLILKEVFRYHPAGMRRSDLFQEGILGLQKAVNRYDADRGIRFSTYATYWIRQSIRKCLIDKSRLIRVPQAIQEEMKKPNSALRPEEKERVRKIMSDTVLLSSGQSDDAEDRPRFQIEDTSLPEISPGLHTQTIPAAVSDAMSELTAREREVVQRRFGLTGGRPQTLEEIGLHLKLSRERIRQIEHEALERMRKSQDLKEVYEDLDLVESALSTSHN